jgi:endoglucanase
MRNDLPKSTFHRLLVLLLALVPALSWVATSNVIAAAPEDSFLGTDGLLIRNGHGHGDAVLLRGVNIGGWLLKEMWMCPLDSSGIKDEFSIRKTLEDRFGADTADDLINTYEDHWITEHDLDNIAALRMNVIRVPFWYRNLQSETGDSKPDAFKRLDWVVAKAWERHIYTILDLHGAPGGQSDNQTTGCIRKKALLWSNAADQDRTVAIWQSIARRYKGNPAVAAYDLLNEPWGASTRQAYWDLHDRLFREIRKVDPDHIITVEGCWGGEVDGKHIGWGWDDLPVPSQIGWTNVMYQIHSYDFKNWQDADAQRRNTDGQVRYFKEHQQWNVPCFVGEFNVMSPQPDPGKIWAEAIDAYDANKMNWTVWSYKSGRRLGRSDWGIYNPQVHLTIPDLSTDSADAIREAWSRLDTEKSFAINPVLKQVLGGTR